MSDLTTSSDVDALLQCANFAAMRGALGLAPGLPVWTLQATDGSDPTLGGFTVDNLSHNSTTQLKFSPTSKNGGDIPLDDTVAGHTVLLITNSAGKVWGFILNAAPSGGVTFILQVSITSAEAGNWVLGDYQISFLHAYFQNMPETLAASGITPVADGTYVTGFGVSQNGSITIQGGIITNVVEARS